MKNIDRHPNIISYIEYAQNVERCRGLSIDNDFVEYLALEYAENKTLLDYLMSKPDLMGE
jgi:hypothetical protein